MLYVRYNKNNEIVDQEVTMENADKIYHKLKRKYGYVEIVLVLDGVEHYVL